MIPGATVYVVDDDLAVRDSLTLLLEQEGVAVESFDSAEAFLAARRSPRNSCAIIDIRMTGMNGLELQEELSNRELALPIIFLTGYGDIPSSVQAIKAGAVNFLTKPITGARLFENVEVALLESARLCAEAEVRDAAKSSLTKLTEREREVLAFAAQGMSNKEIAIRLGISFRTVEIHRAHIMTKTGAESLLDLARIVSESN